MSDKKIALFTNKFPAPVSTFFARDLTALLQRGFAVDVFTTYPIEDKYWNNVPVELRGQIQDKVDIIFVNPLNFTLRNIEPEVRSQIKSILRQSLKFGVPQLLKSLSVTQQALRWSTRFDGRYDYLLSYWGNYAGTYAFLANQLSKHKPPYSFFLHAGVDLYRDQIFLEQKILAAAKVFLVCRFNYEFLRNLYPQSFKTFKDKLVVYRQGIDIANFAVNIDHREPMEVLVIGSLTPPKGFAYAIKALALLVDEFPAIRLVVVGDGPERGRLESLARSLGIEKRVRFTGWLAFDEVKRYLRQSTVLVHPSSDLGDAVPTVLKEAMASGLPTIGADIVGIPEILDQGNVGLLFPPRDHVQLANQMRKLLADKEFREQLAVKARRYAEGKFDLGKNQEFFTQHIEADL